MTSNNDKDDIYKFSFDGITLGEAYRQYRKLLLDEAAGTTDESGSSLADHLLDIDMGGAGAGAPVMVGGLHGPKFQRLRMTRAKKSYKLVVLTSSVVLRNGRKARYSATFYLFVFSSRANHCSGQVC